MMRILERSSRCEGDDEVCKGGNVKPSEAREKHDLALRGQTAIAAKDN